MKPTKADIFLSEQHGGHAYKRNSRNLKRFIEENRKVKYKEKKVSVNSGMTGMLCSIGVTDLDELLVVEDFNLN
ncbi:MAG: hypothetical protein ACPG5W_04440 [Flavobacteriales bacterium]